MRGVVGGVVIMYGWGGSWLFFCIIYFYFCDREGGLFMSDRLSIWVVEILCVLV